MSRMSLGVGVSALLATALPAQVPGGAVPAWWPGAAGDLAFETSAFLLATAYTKADRVADEMAPDGAYGPLSIGWEQGTKDRWLIEEQRYAIDVVIAGLNYYH